MANICAIPQCDSRTYVRGWCGLHYRRWLRHGDPEHREKLRGALPLERLATKIDVQGDCWIWRGAKNADGYGRFYLDGRYEMAYRAAWMLLVGEIPDGLQLDHLCRVPACVNPDHLQPVTAWTNVLRSVAPAARNARKTQCPRGHPYNAANTYILMRPNGRQKRACRICGRAARARYKARSRAS